MEAWRIRCKCVVASFVVDFQLFLVSEASGDRGQQRRGIKLPLQASYIT